jgi:hypothetical protein
MRFLFQLGLLALSWVVGTQATALDDYVWAHDDNYKWTDMVINFLVPFTFKIHYLLSLPNRDPSTRSIAPWMPAPIKVFHLLRV